MPYVCLLKHSKCTLNRLQGNGSARSRKCWILRLRRRNYTYPGSQAGTQRQPVLNSFQVDFLLIRSLTATINCHSLLRATHVTDHLYTQSNVPKHNMHWDIALLGLVLGSLHSQAWRNRDINRRFPFILPMVVRDSLFQHQQQIAAELQNRSERERARMVFSCDSAAFEHRDSIPTRGRTSQCAWNTSTVEIPQKCKLRDLCDLRFRYVTDC